MFLFRPLSEKEVRGLEQFIYHITEGFLFYVVCGITDVYHLSFASHSLRRKLPRWPWLNASHIFAWAPVSKGNCHNSESPCWEIQVTERFKSLIFPCEASIWADNYWSEVHVATVHIRATLIPSLHARLSDNENYISGKSLHITKCYWVKSKSEFFHIVYESSCFCADKLLPAGGTFYDCAGGISSGVVLNCFPPFDLQFKLIVLSEKKYSFECCMKWAKGWALLRQRLDPGVILSKQHSGWSFHNPWSVKPISSSLFELRSILKDWESS